MKSGLLRARLQPCRKWLDRDAALAAEGPLADLQTFPEIRANNRIHSNRKNARRRFSSRYSLVDSGKTRIPFGNDKQKNPSAAKAFFL